MMRDIQLLSNYHFLMCAVHDTTPKSNVEVRDRILPHSKVLQWSSLVEILQKLV